MSQIVWLIAPDTQLDSACQFPWQAVTASTRANVAKYTINYNQEQPTH